MASYRPSDKAFVSTLSDALEHLERFIPYYRESIMSHTSINFARQFDKDYGGPASCAGDITKILLDCIEYQTGLTDRMIEKLSNYE